MTTNHTLDVPGARLHYEVRGAGPLLLVMGAPMAAAAFRAAGRRARNPAPVITHDLRGISGSPLDDPSRTPPPSCGRTTSPPSWTP